MNKDVIYIEPEHDITDIIDKVKTSKQKIVALIPPKKSAVLSSAVNVKLLARAGRAAGKSLVLVTPEPGLLKLAAMAEIPAAKNLQTRPEIPLIVKDNTKTDGTIASEEATSLTADAKEDLVEATPTEAEAIEMIESEDSADPSADDTIEVTDADPISDPDTDDELASDSEADSAADGKIESAKPKQKPKIPNFDRYRKWIILGAAALVLIVGFLIWALVFAPYAKIVVAVRTTPDNYSSAISFVTDPQKEIIADGIFALESADLTKKVTANFAATGEANRGDKATGQLTLTRTRVSTDVITVPKGTTFTHGELSYTSTEAASLATPQDGDCASYSGSAMAGNLACTALKPTITATVTVIATTPGISSNLAAQTSGWTSGVSGFTTTSGEIAGGTDKIVKVVSRSDFDSAKSLLATTSESEGRTELIQKLGSSSLPIEASIKIESKEPTSSPKVGEEVAEGVTPAISAETVFSMYGVDRNKIEQYIKDQYSPTLPRGQELYATGVHDDKTRIENYRTEEGSITAKLTTYGIQYGPILSESEIFDKSRGQKIGEVKNRIIRDMIGSNGTIDITASPFWVSSIPEDPNKVDVIIEIE